MKFESIDQFLEFKNGSLLAGTINLTASKNTFTPSDLKMVDPDGEVLDLRNLHLSLAGSALPTADDVPDMKPEHMQDFSKAVARAVTYDQRHLPLKEKFIMLWKFFCELFFNRIEFHTNDPYREVVEQWYAKQRIPLSLKSKWWAFKRGVKSMFFHTDPDNIHTELYNRAYGMTGFMPTKK